MTLVLAHRTDGDTYNSNGLPLTWVLPLNKYEGEIGCMAIEAEAYISRQDAFPEVLLILVCLKRQRKQNQLTCCGPVFKQH
jgi:hypothetical protein